MGPNGEPVRRLSRETAIVVATYSSNKGATKAGAGCGVVDEEDYETYKYSIKKANAIPTGGS